MDVLRCFFVCFQVLLALCLLHLKCHLIQKQAVALASPAASCFPPGLFFNQYNNQLYANEALSDSRLGAPIPCKRSTRCSRTINNQQSRPVSPIRYAKSQRRSPPQISPPQNAIPSPKTSQAPLRGTLRAGRSPRPPAGAPPPPGAAPHRRSPASRPGWSSGWRRRRTRRRRGSSARAGRRGPCGAPRGSRGSTACAGPVFIKPPCVVWIRVSQHR